MIEVKLGGGLGNQLFQYAYAKKLQKLVSHEGESEPILLNGTMLRIRESMRKPELQNFILSASACATSSVLGRGGLCLLRYLLRYWCVLGKRILMKKVLGRSIPRSDEDFERDSAHGIIWVHQSYSCRLPKVPLPPNKYCIGFFQSYATVDGMEEELRGDLRIKDEVPLSSENACLLDAINTTESVCVHIRRGDYLLPENDMYNVCTEEYYRRAIHEAKRQLKNPVFYIFSGSKQDVDYIRTHYTLGEHVRYVDLGNGTIDDFRLMKACKHFIISNSTYSWWTALLGNHNEKKVWAPTLWRKDLPHAADELYAPSWMRIEV